MINQKAYLQKYLTGVSSGEKKKKKKKTVAKGQGFKIIDDDIDLTKLRALQGDELDIYDEGDDAPIIAGIIDERPEEVKKQEQFSTSSKWKVVNQDDGFNSKLQIEEIKKDIKEKEKENELIFGKMYSDSEDEKNNDSDLSPPRKNDMNQNNKKSTSSKKHSSDSDFSPPRKRNNRESPSPQRIKVENNNSDQSPPRKHGSSTKKKERIRKPSRWGDSVKETEIPYIQRSSSRSPNRKQSRSPIRKSKKGRRSPSSDISPPRKSRKKEQSDSDQSPPRKLDKRKQYDSDQSPRRKSKKSMGRRKSVDSDMSPPRRRQSPGRQTKYDSKSRQCQYSESPSRKYKREKSISPNRKRREAPKISKRRYNSDSDQSPPRRKQSPKDNKRRYNNDTDQSPPRREREKDRKRRNSDSPPPSNKKMERTLEGKMAGLQDARQLKEENDAFRKREDDFFKKMGDDVSGRNAQTVSRRSKRETSEEKRQKKEKSEKQKELDEKYKKWNKGLKQVEAQESRIQDYIHEASKPLARHRDDRDLEHSLKQVERAGDPMLQYIREKKRERGELAPERPSYKGNFPPNRFNIPPGYRWDGVDRSNGYEKKYFEQKSKRKAQEEEAYKWSVEDL